MLPTPQMHQSLDAQPIWHLLSQSDTPCNSRLSLGKQHTVQRESPRIAEKPGQELLRYRLHQRTVCGEQRTPGHRVYQGTAACYNQPVDSEVHGINNLHVPCQGQRKPPRYHRQVQH